MQNTRGSEASSLHGVLEAGSCLVASRSVDPKAGTAVFFVLFKPVRAVSLSRRVKEVVAKHTT